jgi:hypothetical protein
MSVRYVDGFLDLPSGEFGQTRVVDLADGDGVVKEGQGLLEGV